VFPARFFNNVYSALTELASTSVYDPRRHPSFLKPFGQLHISHNFYGTKLTDLPDCPINAANYFAQTYGAFAGHGTLSTAVLNVAIS
jgi:hypothetical protein